MDFSFDTSALKMLNESYYLLLRDRREESANNVLTNVADYWRGATPQSWVSNIFLDDPPIELTGMPDAAMSRTELHQYLQSDPNPHRALAAILAWGGTGYRARDHISSTWSDWVMTFHALKGKRSEAQYTHYLKATKERSLRGLGPAFFTKIIFFTAGEESPGYILDQWTARSANALTNDNTFIRLNPEQRVVQPDGILRPRGFIVSSRNSPERYARFNRLVEAVADNLGCSPEHAELIMFSKATFWRAYLVQRANENRNLSLEMTS
ncbi:MULTISPECIES: hypothetical protein [unclassified Brevundimonas]|uniref:8-oxoguanine DNA glycosylase OGG fold protein n=1 Tax=unclassified Brevundimonas TaxID=2622653 RepID=UPI0025C387DD|nr:MULTISPECIES: hypothetical protein [unclassified Brevundimonas]